MVFGSGGWVAVVVAVVVVASLELLQRVFGSEAGKKISGERVTYRSHLRLIALLPVVKMVLRGIPHM